MTQPFGFVPPVAIPAVGGAANAIIPTAGVLGGAVAGAKAGAVLGPKGALAGAVAGALLAPLLFPLPTNPGTLPPGLDPGLNDPEPEPDPALPPTGLDPTVIPGPADDPVGTEYLWTIDVFQVRKTPPKFSCSSGAQLNNGSDSSSQKSYTGRGERIKVWSIPRYRYQICGPQNDDSGVDNGSIGGADVWRDGKWETLITEGNYFGGTLVNTSAFQKDPTESRFEQWDISRDAIPVTAPDGLNGTPETIPEKPRPQPLPIRTLPVPITDPEVVPVREPEPQPDPLEVPSPDTPNAPPITIPKAPPAVPQAPPRPSPFPNPTEPRTVPLPVPIPGVPTVPEPSPDPNVVPAPGPTPLPSPSPAPVPGTDPQPGEAPIPVPPQTPIPTIPATPTTPDTSTPTTPDGSVAPQPTPLPNPTPPNVHFPVPGAPPVTDGGVRADLASIAAEVGRIEQKTAQLQSNQKDIPWWLIGPILEALGALLENDIPGTTYSLQGICEDVDEGEDQPIAEFPVEPAKNLGAIINRLDTIDQMLQQHLAWKTPTCKTKFTPVGDWRTISFISDEVSPYGSARLRKRFRYRSLSGVGLPGVIDHWKGFTWQAGPVCVQHADAPWGTPQCWASTAAEGKRVIRHAAGEAGIDPDQNGRWIISGSDSPRVGVPGTMRVNTKGGYYWITARDGSDGRPIVGEVDTNP